MGIFKKKKRSGGGKKGSGGASEISAPTDASHNTDVANSTMIEAFKASGKDPASLSEAERAFLGLQEPASASGYMAAPAPMMYGADLSTGGPPGYTTDEDGLFAGLGDDVSMFSESESDSDSDSELPAYMQAPGPAMVYGADPGLGVPPGYANDQLDAVRMMRAPLDDELAESSSEEDPLEDFDLMDEEEQREALAEAAPESRKAWHRSIAENASMPATPLVDHYLGEEMNLHDPRYLPNNFGPGRQATGTHYADSADEFGTTVEGGKVTRGGETLDSIGNKRQWAKDKDERMNFAMDAAGGLYTADPKKEFDASRDAQAGTVTRNNHSSLLGGADAAAAGTLKVREGKVEELGDGSGHYRPSAAQTHGAVSKLVEAGAMEEERSSVRLSGKGGDQKDVLMSTMEMMAYQDEMDAAKGQYATSGDAADLAAPEASIRAAHGKKDAMLAELLSKTPGEHLDAAKAGAPAQQAEYDSIEDLMGGDADLDETEEVPMVYVDQDYLLGGD